MRVAGRSTRELALIAVASGAGLGLASLLAVRFLPHPANLIGTLGGPWLAVAFTVGAVARDRQSAAWAGAASMAAAAVAYYVARWALSPHAPGGLLVGGEVVPYLVIGLLAGTGMAVVGALWRTGRARVRGVAAGLLAGALGAEVIVLASRAWRGQELVFAAIQGGAAVLVAWILPRSWRGRVIALIVGIASAVVVAGAILALDLPLRLFR